MEDEEDEEDEGDQGAATVTHGTDWSILLFRHRLHKFLQFSISYTYTKVCKYPNQNKGIMWARGKLRLSIVLSYIDYTNSCRVRMPESAEGKKCRREAS